MVYKDRDPVREVTILDAQWSNLPDDVMEDIQRYWRYQGFGNDYFYVRYDVEQQREDSKWSDEHWEEEKAAENRYEALNQYLEGRGIESILLHYWW